MSSPEQTAVENGAAPGGVQYNPDPTPVDPYPTQSPSPSHPDSQTQPQPPQPNPNPDANANPTDPQPQPTPPDNGNPSQNADGNAAPSVAEPPTSTLSNTNAAAAAAPPADGSRKRSSRWSSHKEQQQQQTAADGSTEEGQRKRSRWASKTDTAATAPAQPDPFAGLSPEQVEQMKIQLRIEEIGCLLQRPADALRASEAAREAMGRPRSPSPEPTYDAHGIRTNTRQQRLVKVLEKERALLVEALQKLNPSYRPPAGFKKMRYERRLRIPVDEYPDYNFIGMIIGPRGNCFPTDHEVLTREGFLDLAGIEQRLTERGKVDIACPVGQRLEYRPITAEELIVHRGVHEHVAIEDSLSSRSSSTQLSLCPTSNHRMYVRMDWKGLSASAYAIREAHTFISAAANDASTSVQFQCNVPDGVTTVNSSTTPLPFAAPLNLTTPDEVNAFLELYGYWLTNGWLDNSNDRSAVAFRTKTSVERDYLNHLFSRLQRVLPMRSATDRSATATIAPGVWMEARSSKCRSRSGKRSAHHHYYLTSPAWLTYFMQHCGCTRNDVDKRLFSWVWKRLSKSQLRLILRGLAMPSSQSSPHSGEIRTSSVLFRDETQRLAIHAGYAATFRLSHARKHEWTLSYSDDIKHTQPRLLVEKTCKTVKREGTVWCVSVPTEEQLIIVRRVERSMTSKNGERIVSAASRPVIVGNTQKRMEKESGCKIVIRGRGSQKEGRQQKGRPMPGDDEPLHVLISGDDEDRVIATAKEVEKLLVPIDETKNEHKARQLRELAVINGTLRDEIICRLCGRPGHRQIHCPERNQSWTPANIRCGICNSDLHPTQDCPHRHTRTVEQAQREMDSAYSSFMEELTGEGPIAKQTAQPLYLGDGSQGRGGPIGGGAGGDGATGDDGARPPPRGPTIHPDRAHHHASSAPYPHTGSRVVKGLDPRDTYREYRGQSSSTPLGSLPAVSHREGFSQAQSSDQVSQAYGQQAPPGGGPGGYPGYGPPPQAPPSGGYHNVPPPWAQRGPPSQYGSGPGYAHPPPHHQPYQHQHQQPPHHQSYQGPLGSAPWSGPPPQHQQQQQPYQQSAPWQQQAQQQPQGPY